MSSKVYFGLPGAIEEIPAPKSGMGFVSRVDNEESELVSGGRSIYRAPTAYKTFNMTWQTSSSKLRHLIDIYNGQMGPGPYYITDPHANPENLLPPRWSNAWQLAHQANGWCRPEVLTQAIPLSPSTSTPRTDRYVKFTQALVGPTVKLEGIVKHRMIRIPGKPYFLSVNGTPTGGAGIRYRLYNSGTNSWSAPALFATYTGAPVSIVPDTDTTTSMIELDIYMPLGSTLILKGLALGTVNTRLGQWMPVGQGVGAVSFTNNSEGELISSVIDRVGLSLDFVEVQSVESRML